MQQQQQAVRAVRGSRRWTVNYFAAVASYAATKNRRQRQRGVHIKFTSSEQFGVTPAGRHRDGAWRFWWRHYAENCISAWYSNNDVGGMLCNLLIVLCIYAATTPTTSGPVTGQRIVSYERHKVRWISAATINGGWRTFKPKKLYMTGLVLLLLVWVSSTIIGQPGNNLYQQTAAEISRHSALSEDRIRQCGTSSESPRKDTDQCL